MASVLPHRSTIDLRHKDAARHVERALESVLSRALKVRLWGVRDGLNPEWDDARLNAEEVAFDEGEREDYRMGVELVRGVHR